MAPNGKVRRTARVTRPSQRRSVRSRALTGLRRWAAARRSTAMVPASVRPELKKTVRLFPMATLTYGPTITFQTQYPATTWASQDMFPSIGTTGSQYIGNKIYARSINFDFILSCTDQNVECRFVMFKWKAASNPDNTTAWNNPLTGTLSTAGAGFNPWFSAKSDEYVQVLYQKAFRLNAKYVPSTSVPAYASVPGRARVKRNIRLGYVIRPYTDTVGGMTNSTPATNTSWRGRVYWCIVTNNYAGSDLGIVGNMSFNYNDA